MGWFRLCCGSKDDAADPHEVSALLGPNAVEVCCASLRFQSAATKMDFPFRATERARTHTDTNHIRMLLQNTCTQAPNSTQNTHAHKR